MHGIGMRARAQGMLRAAGVTLVLVSAGRASATSLNWNNVAGGSAATAANWSPVQVPTSVDDLVFNLNNTYTVTYNATVGVVLTHTYRKGVVTLVISSPHTASTGITVGDLVGDSVTTVLTTGTWTSNGAVIVGDASGSIGMLNVNDEDANLILATSAGDLTVANNGSGTLNITNGGLVQVADQLIVGGNSTSTPTLVVSGFHTPEPLTRSTLDVLGPSQSRLGQGGDAVVTISNGALAQFAGDVVVANGSASVSDVTVATVGLLPATLSIAGDLLLGRNTSTAAAGSGTLNVNDGGAVSVGDTLFVGGDPNGGTGVLHMTSGTLTTHALSLGNGGTLDLDGGILDIVGGTFENTNTATSLALGGVNHPVLTLQGGATANLTTIVGARAVTVGGGPNGSFANFDVRGGSDLTIGNGDVVIGEGSGDDGSMIVNGSGSTFTMPATEILTVGQSGQGRFEAELGGQVAAGIAFVAQNAGAGGLLLIETAGTTAQFAQVFVGGSSVAAGGNGEFTVNANATASVVGSGTATRIWPPGLLRVVSATLTCTNTVRCDGNILLNNGTINAGTVLVFGDLFGTGTVNANVDGSDGVISAVNGPLTLGLASSTSGFAAISPAGLLEVNAQTVTLHDANLADCGDITIVGGTLAAPNGVRLPTGSDLSGFGTLNADVLSENGSTITATGTGLRFGGILQRNQNFGGTTIGFDSGGGFTGSGSITALIDADAGSIVTATGDLDLGDPNASNATTIRGELHVGNHHVHLQSQNDVGLGTLTTLTGGTLEGPQDTIFPMFLANIELSSGEVLEGFGTVDSGLTGPANSAINATGDLTISGTRDEFTFPFGSFDGALNVYSHTVTYLGGARLGASVLLEGGTLVAPAGEFIFLSSSDVTGFGTLAGETNVGGTVSPAGLAGDAIGRLFFQGPYTQSDNGQLNIDIGGLVAGTSLDRVDVVGAPAVLGGTLNVSLVNGFIPDVGAVIAVMTYPSHTSDFTTKIVPTDIPDRRFTAHTLDTAVNVLAGLTGDLNCDGLVDFGDINPFVLALSNPTAYESEFPDCGLNNGDCNGDGLVDFGDINSFVALFGGA